EDASVRAQALSALGQIGSERAEQAVVAATRSGKTEDRVAAVHSLASMDDVRATRELARLIRDPDPEVAHAAISASYRSGPEVEAVLVQLRADPSAPHDTKLYAATSLRPRGGDLDERTEKIVTELAGPAYGGYGYGGYEGYDH